MNPTDKQLMWMVDLKTPPTPDMVRVRAGFLLRLLQQGHNLSLPESRPMPTIGSGCHELRLNSDTTTWRIIYRVDSDAIVVVDVFAKKTKTTSQAVIKRCQDRLKTYDEE